MYQEIRNNFSLVTGFFQHRVLETLCCVLAITPLVSCGEKHNDSSQVKIYGGTEVQPGNWENVVGIVFKRGDDFYIECTGTLIHPKLVLTAGHCLDEFLDGAGPTPRADQSWDNIGVVTGPGIEGGKLSDISTIKRAAKGFVHENLRALPRGNADIGLLVLESELLEPTTQVIPLLSDLSESITAISPNEMARLVGYGQREDNSKGRKFEVETPVVAKEGAEARLGGNGKDSCSGDSGGPAFVKVNGSTSGITARSETGWRQAGIVSRGLNIGCGEGGIVTLTPDYICWLEEKSGFVLAENTANLGCGLPNTIYSAKELTKMDFRSICNSKKSNAMQKHTVNAIMLALKAATCGQADAKLAVASTLDLQGKRIRDLSPLANAPELRSIDLSANLIEDVATLQTIRKLMSANVSYNNVRDFNSVSGLIASGTKIRGRNLQKSNFLNTKFRELCDSADATAEQVKTVRAIRSKFMTGDCVRANLLLSRQSELRIANRQLTDLTPFMNLENLTDLDLSGNPISDVSALAGLENLKVLDLTGTNVTDISALVELLAMGLEIRRNSP